MHLQIKNCSAFRIWSLHLSGFRVFESRSGRADSGFREVGRGRSTLKYVAVADGEGRPEGAALGRLSLEVGVLGRPRERLHVTDVGHARHEKQQAVEAQAEARVRRRTPAAGIEIPPEFLLVHAQFGDSCMKFAIIGLSLRTADDFADSREQYVHGAHRLAVVVLLHVEGLDVLGVVDQDDRTLEVLLHEVALVLGLQVAAPVAGEFELAARSLQNLDAFGVVETLEIVLQHKVQTLQQPLVPHLVHKFEVFHAVVQRIPDEVFEEILGQFHVVLQFEEGRFRLDHPELRRMARGVRVFGTERGAEGVDAAQRECAQLAFELARHREVARLAEEVLRVVDRPLPGPGQVVHIERRHLEHRTGALAVRSRDDRGVEIVESVFVEIF